MVLPGWNVTEPLQVAGKFYIFVRAYRDADEQIKNFASSVNDFCVALQALDKCLKSPHATPLDDNDPLKVASDGCQRCAESCQKFVKNFFSSNELDPNQPDAHAGDGLGPKRRLNWMWKKDAATKLTHEMSQQILYISLHLNIAEREDRQRQGSTAVLAVEPKPLTPRDLFSRQDRSNFPVTIPSISSPPTDAEPCRDLPTEYVYQEIASRRDSGVSLGAFSNAIMHNLSGVTLCRMTQNAKWHQVKRLEFLRDPSGSLHCIVATLSAGHAVKFSNQVSPSSQLIPHTEHPAANNDRRILRIKFLESHLLTSEKWSTSSNMPSPNSLDSSSIRSVSTSSHGTPESLPSNRRISKSSSIGSPLLPPDTPPIREEPKFPWFTFEYPKDYKMFQEYAYGKELLANVPVNKIVNKYIGSSRSHLQCETQCLRLWKSTAQTVMLYYANGLDKHRYLEHDSE
ncbi:hypothetical protein MMC07_000859 [Pseudocyphellaria aurata]|nr:hypothetical protein [Pseudocyphellaria aurata]